MSLVSYTSVRPAICMNSQATRLVPATSVRKRKLRRAAAWVLCGFWSAQMLNMTNGIAMAAAKFGNTPSKY